MEEGEAISVERQTELEEDEEIKVELPIHIPIHIPIYIILTLCPCLYPTDMGWEKTLLDFSLSPYLEGIG